MITLFPKFKLAMGQMLVEGGKVEENLKRAETMIEKAAENGCQIIILPECLDTGWTHPSAKELAKEIPGETADRLCQAAAENGIMVVAGITERSHQKIYNSAILIDEKGSILLKHRKINVLKIAQDLYSIGNILSVVETKLGTIGVNICADNFMNSLAIGHVQARMGAHFIFSPSSWAVKAEHDNTKQPYGEFWRKSYTELCRLYGITVVGVSNVGWITAGPWRGRKVIGCSLAVGPDGKVIAKGPYGADAEALIPIEIQAKPRDAKGTEYSRYLKEKGYSGP
ncbi:carbon-nitrogen hydrolase family protein [Candidatus Bathyarchaeota archaeon]|nr:MAG: carbon-nitrogen hydrolase family protein [Candidatus Bathyarchaeota archaeon]